MGLTRLRLPWPVLQGLFSDNVVKLVKNERDVTGRRFYSKIGDWRRYDSW